MTWKLFLVQERVLCKMDIICLDKLLPSNPWLNLSILRPNKLLQQSTIKRNNNPQECDTQYVFAVPQQWETEKIFNKSYIWNPQALLYFSMSSVFPVFYFSAQDFKHFVRLLSVFKWETVKNVFFYYNLKEAELKEMFFRDFQSWRWMHCIMHTRATYMTSIKS